MKLLANWQRQKYNKVNFSEIIKNKKNIIRSFLTFAARLDNDSYRKQCLEISGKYRKNGSYVLFRENKENRVNRENKENTGI